MLISISENTNSLEGKYFGLQQNAFISFENGHKYPISIHNPFSEQEEQDLEWYFEDHLRLPFVKQVKAHDVAASIQNYGEKLFQQIFADKDAYGHYEQALQASNGQLHFEIAGSPEFHSWHWETLKDPKRSRSFALEVPMVRKNLQALPLVDQPTAAATLRLLIVTARPGGQRDVGYRTITRPLVETLSETGLSIEVEILRPGTFRALSDHLKQVGKGYYHVIHFDVHGTTLTWDDYKSKCVDGDFLCSGRYGRSNLMPYQGTKAFLFLETDKNDQRDPVEAGELAKLLGNFQIPIVILNACQSGKQIGVQETSLGSRLMQAGVQLVVAMGYSITVSAAELLMRTLYKQIFSNPQELSKAIQYGRLELYNNKGRRAHFDQIIDLEDWLLPVVYQNQEVHLQFKQEDQKDLDSYQEANYIAPNATYGFFGRDLDILQIERQLFRHNFLLLRGMAGAGKSTLLHHLGYWWQRTNWVDKVFYFGYDQRAWSHQQLLAGIAQRVLGQDRYDNEFQPLSLAAQQEFIVNQLQNQRHLLIMDNLESISSKELVIPSTLPAEEQAVIRDFLSELIGGKTLILLGSRSGEEWLADASFKLDLQVFKLGKTLRNRVS